MADEDKPVVEHHAAAKKEAAPRTKASTKGADDSVKVDNENYVGVDPIYQNSAYEEPLALTEVPSDASDEEKEAIEAEIAMVETVKANEEGCVVETEEPVPFEEWVGEQASTVAKSRVPGGLSEEREEDMTATEEAKDDDGKIAPHSTSLHQPGVNRV